MRFAARLGVAALVIDALSDTAEAQRSISCDQQRTSSIVFTGDTVEYSLFLPNFENLTISTCFDTTSFDTTLRLRDENGAELEYNDDGCGDNGLSSIITYSASPGTYVIEVAGFSSTTGTFGVCVDCGSGVCDDRTLAVAPDPQAGDGAVADASSGLLGGAIAGIVIGGICGTICIVGAIIAIVRSGQKKQSLPVKSAAIGMNTSPAYTTSNVPSAAPTHQPYVPGAPTHQPYMPGGGQLFYAPQPMPGQSMPGQPMPGQPMPGQPMPGQPMPGQPMVHPVQTSQPVQMNPSAPIQPSQTGQSITYGPMGTYPGPLQSAPQGPPPPF